MFESVTSVGFVSSHCQEAPWSSSLLMWAASGWSSAFAHRCLWMMTNGIAWKLRRTSRRQCCSLMGSTGRSGTAPHRDTQNWSTTVIYILVRHMHTYISCIQKHWFCTKLSPPELAGSEQLQGLQIFTVFFFFDGGTPSSRSYVLCV